MGTERFYLNLACLQSNTAFVLLSVLVILKFSSTFSLYRLETQIFGRLALCGQGPLLQEQQQKAASPETQTHPGDDLEAGLLLVVDLQPRDDLP